MELNWLECLFYGLISGLTEFLPISSLAHQTVLLRLLGTENPACLRLSVLLGALAALLMACFPMLNRLHREWRIHCMPKKRRRRHPDFAALMEMRVFRTGAIMVILLFLGHRFVQNLNERLWVLAVLIGVNGLLLYIPQYLPGANKTAQSLSRLDAVLIGMAAGFGFVPGISATGCAISVARIRGADRKYAADLSLLLCVPVLILMIFPQFFATMHSDIPVDAVMILNCTTAALAAFFSAYWGIILVRFMAVNVGYAGFGYYCWGLALFTLILYLI